MRISVLTLLILCGLVAPAAAGKNCTCRANGQKYPEGQMLCIRGKLSRCEMNQNVTSWKVVADICPEAKTLPPDQPHSQLNLAQLQPTAEAAFDRSDGLKLQFPRRR